MMIVISERKVIAFQEIDICLKVIDSAAKAAIDFNLVIVHTVIEIINGKGEIGHRFRLS